jgi:hypothetical protein
MRPTQYMIMVTIACGVTKEYGGDNHFTDIVVTVLIIGLCSPLLLFLIVRLLKPDFADKVVRRLYLLRYYRERKSLSMELKKAIDPIENKGEGYYILQEAIDDVFGSADSGPGGRARVIDAVKLFAENEKRKKIAVDYETLKREALVALCEAVGIELERLRELEQRGLMRRKRTLARALGITLDGMTTHTNPMTEEIADGTPNAIITTVGTGLAPNNPTCNEDEVGSNSKNRRTSQMKEQMGSYINRDSITHLNRVGGKKKGEKKVLFATDSMGGDEKSAPAAVKQLLKHEQAEGNASSGSSWVPVDSVSEKKPPPKQKEPSVRRIIERRAVHEI